MRDLLQKGGREGKDASGRPFSAPRFNSHPSKNLSLSISLLAVASRLYAAAELFKNSAASSVAVAKFGKA